MQNTRFEIHVVPQQLINMRKLWSAHLSGKRHVQSADFAGTYVTLCAAIEYIAGYHLRSELEALQMYVYNTAPEGPSPRISRTNLRGETIQYDQSRGRKALIRLTEKEERSAIKLTFGDIQSLRTWLVGESLKEFCDRIDFSMYNDLLGLYALRNVFAHGRPLRLDADVESPHNIAHPQFSLLESVKTLERVVKAPRGITLEEQNDALSKIVFSPDSVRFYWNRVSLFATRYVSEVPKDISFLQPESIQAALTPL